MPVCAVQLCRNRRGKLDDEKLITYHRFPADPVLAKRWTDVIRKTRGDILWKPHKTSVVCSNHFHNDEKYFTKKGLRQRLKSGAVPSKRLFLSGTDKESSPIKEKDPTVTNLEIESQAETKPSCSKETIDDDDSAKSFSDLDSVFDSPSKAKLRKELRHKIKQEQKHRTVIKSLREKNVRLKKKNASFKTIIETLMKQRFSRKCVRCNLILSNE